MEASAFEIGLLILVGVLLLIPLAIKIVSSLLAYRQESRYLYMELQRSESEEEREQWRRALSYERLCLLPFVTPKNVRSVYRFFHKPGEKKQEKDGFARSLAPAVLCIVLCMVSLCGMTFAWFSASTGSTTQQIQSATYGITATVTQEGVEVSATEAQTYTLTAGKNYAFTLVQEEGTTASTGYCVVTLTNANGTTVLYANPVQKTAFTFTVTAPETEDLKVTLTAVWGNLPSTVQEENMIANGGNV